MRSRSQPGDRSPQADGPGLAARRNEAAGDTGPGDTGPGDTGHRDGLEPAGAAYDVRAVRAHFPALREGAAHFDGPGGSQVPDVVGAAVATTMTAAMANRGQITRAERRADRVVADGRAAMADLVGADPSGIVFGRSMTQLTYDFARMLARQWGPGDAIAVTRLDHDANIRPWVQAAAAVGASVQWIDFDPETGRLTTEHAAAVITERTRLVAVTGASNLIGTRPPVTEISRLAHAVGAVTYVDGVHLTPHAPVDIATLGADLYACSPYKFLGPHCGVVAGRPEVLEVLRPDKLLPASDTVPERFELGTLPYEMLAGTTAAVDFLAGLGPVTTTGAEPARRARLQAAMALVEEHEARLRRSLESRLAAIDGITVHGGGCDPGSADHGGSAARTPTLLFSVGAIPAAEVSIRLAHVGVNAPAGSFYAIEASRRLGLGDHGAVRVGIAPYTDDRDVDRLIEGLEGLLRPR